MDKTELMEMVNGKAICVSNGFVEIGDDELCSLANAILERAAECIDERVTRMRPCESEREATRCARSIRALKINTGA